MDVRRIQKKRPEDFTRMILAEGTTEDCHVLEVTILKAADAMHSDRFYNQSNGNESIYIKHFTESHKKNLSLSNKGQEPWNKGKHHKPEAVQKIKDHWKMEEVKENFHNKRKGHAVKESTREKLRIKNIGKKQSKETIEKRMNSIKEKGLRGGHKLHSSNTRKHFSDIRKGLPVSAFKTKVKCPHCNKEGPIGNMKQWHFDNCKLKKK